MGFPTLLQGMEGYSEDIPTAAIHAGYNTITFGPTMVLSPGVVSSNGWYPFNFLGVTPSPGQAVQNGTGINLPGADGSNFGANISTAHLVNGVWRGNAFGGGFYIEYVLAHTATLGSSSLPFPAAWGEGIEFLTYNKQWPGQAPGYNHWCEVDAYQWPHNTLTYANLATITDWYGTGSGTALISPNIEIGQNGIPLSTLRNIGLRWIPATSTSQGEIRSYFNRVRVGQPIVWNQYNPANSPPPVIGTSAFSILDTQHMVPIIGTDVTCPMQIASVTIWQNSTANNLQQ